MTPAFIVGSDRSGTTLLRLILNEHSDLTVPAETWFLIDLIDAFGVGASLGSDDIQRAIEIVTSQRRWKNFSITADDLGAAMRGSPDVSLAEFFDTFMTLETAATGRSRWVDKTPEYVLHLPELAEMFPTARFVNITRDGRDVFESLRKQRWRGRTPLRIGRYWAACIDGAFSAGSVLDRDRWLWIKYEDLVFDTPGTIRHVCDFLDVPFEPGMLDFHRTAAAHLTPQALERGFHAKLTRPPAPSDLYKWKQGETGLGSWLFEATTHRQLLAAGYETRMGRGAATMLTPVVYAHHLVASVVAKGRKSIRRARRRKDQRS